MKHGVLLIICLLAFCAHAQAGFPSHRIEGKIESIVISEQKIVFILSGTIKLSMFNADGTGYEMPTTGLYHVPITYYRRPESVDAEATWDKNLEALHDAVGKTFKLDCPNPSYSYERDRITSISTGVLWIWGP